jgi:hypothetical protein
MTIGDPLRRDWHQFRLLSRDAVRQLIDSATLSRDADPTEFALWMLALIATPPAFFAMRQVLLYTQLTEAPAHIVLEIALTHRLFFVTYGMLAAALLAALTWEAVFPDGRDQEIVGVLPVRPHTFAAARLSAAIAVAVVFTGIVNLPAALMYSLFSAGHPLFRTHIPGIFIGHIAATMLGSLLVFFSLLCARGLAAIVFGARAGGWLGAALQLVTVVLMFEVFFFLPGILGTLVTRVLAGDPAALMFPPVWFAALHAWLAGAANDLLTRAMLRGLGAFAIATAVVIPIYLVPARWLGQRALESRPGEHSGGVSSVTRLVATMAGARAPVRGIFIFAIASLLRSRRHLTVLATYFGMAVAISLVASFINDVEGAGALRTPSAWALALPLVFIFFLVLGVRACFRIPTELDANWPFRLTQPALAACLNAAALVMFTAIVVPVAFVQFAAVVAWWPFADVLTATALHLLAGLMFIECVLVGWTKVPFACAHAPSAGALKVWGALYGIAMYLYAFRLSDWQFAALRSDRALLSYLAFVAIVIAIVRLVRHRQLRIRALEFDVVANQTTQRLDLSEALH